MKHIVLLTIPSRPVFIHQTAIQRAVAQPQGLETIAAFEAFFVDHQFVDVHLFGEINFDSTKGT